GVSCGQCGGTVQCNGMCSKPEPAGFQTACGHCGGTIQCDGTCSKPDPAGYNTACGRCGGVVRCDGSCSQPEPPGYGTSCGTCNRLPETTYDWYHHGFRAGLGGVSENRTFGAACPSGIRTQCIVERLQGNVYLVGWASDDPRDCRCVYHIGASALSNVEWQV